MLVDLKLDDSDTKVAFGLSNSLRLNVFCFFSFSSRRYLTMLCAT